MCRLYLIARTKEQSCRIRCCASVTGCSKLVWTTFRWVIRLARQSRHKWISCLARCLTVIRATKSSCIFMTHAEWPLPISCDRWNTASPGLTARSAGWAAVRMHRERPVMWQRMMSCICCMVLALKRESMKTNCRKQPCSFKANSKKRCRANHWRTLQAKAERKMMRKIRLTFYELHWGEVFDMEFSVLSTKFGSECTSKRLTVVISEKFIYSMVKKLIHAQGERSELP